MWEWRNGYKPLVTANQKEKHGTAAAMHQTAEARERSEAILHESAEASPDEETRQRLHRLGDEVTRQAVDIDKRADFLDPPDGPRR
jgi:hypothetical protein